jgi:hypothetical protein
MMFIKKRASGVAGGALIGFFEIDQVSQTNPLSPVGSIAVSVGDIIYVLVAQQTSATATAGTDNLGHTYTMLAAGDDVNRTGEGLFTRVTNAGTLTQVDITATASSQNVACIVAAFTGPSNASPLDKNPAAITADISSPYVCPATGVLAQADELVIAWFVQDGNVTISATAPNTLIATQNTSTVLTAALAYQKVTATTSIAPEFTSSVTPTESVLGTTTFKLT